MFPDDDAFQNEARVEKLYMEDPRMVLAALPWPRHLDHMTELTNLNREIKRWCDVHFPVGEEHPRAPLENLVENVLVRPEIANAGGMPSKMHHDVPTRVVTHPGRDAWATSYLMLKRASEIDPADV